MGQKVLDTKMVPVFAIKNAMDSCSLIVIVWELNFETVFGLLSCPFHRKGSATQTQLTAGMLICIGEACGQIWQ